MLRIIVPEDSEFTSIAQRLAEFTTQSTIPEHPENQPLNLKPRFSSDAPPPTSIPLADFVAESQTVQGIPYSLNDYVELSFWQTID